MFARLSLSLVCVMMLSACFKTLPKDNYPGGEGDGKPVPELSELAAHAWCASPAFSDGSRIQEQYAFNNAMSFQYVQNELNENGVRTGRYLKRVSGTYTLFSNTLELRPAGGGAYSRYYVAYDDGGSFSGTETLFMTTADGAEVKLLPCF